MIEIKDRWWRDMEDSFEPMSIEEKYWIYDNKLNQYVRPRFVKKSIWDKPWYAKLSFNNATWVRMDDQTRYEVIKIQ